VSHISVSHIDKHRCRRVRQHAKQDPWIEGPRSRLGFSPESPAAARAAIAEVEEFCADTGYPQTRFDAATLAASELLRRVAAIAANQ
jgi:hypothetical protein